MKPASQEQKDLAADLDITLPPNTSSKEATRLINQAPPSKGQRELADAMGVTLGEDVTFPKATIIIRSALPAINNALLAEWKLKAGDILKFEGSFWQVGSISPVGQLWLKPVRVQESSGRLVVVPTGQKSVLKNAFTIRTAEKVDPQNLSGK